MAEDDSPTADESEPERSPAPPEQQESFSDLRHYVPADLLTVSFPTSVRGYDRHAVEAHLERVNRVIAELKVHASPRAAVTHALEQTEQQVSGLLQRARETGEEITASARQEGEEITAGAKAEAAELLVNVSAEADGVKAQAEKLIADARTEAEDTLVRSRLEAEDTLARARRGGRAPSAAAGRAGGAARGGGDAAARAAGRHGGGLEGTPPAARGHPWKGERAPRSGRRCGCPEACRVGGRAGARGGR